MVKRTKIYALILLALCLVVPVASAYQLTLSDSDFMNLDSNTLSVSIGDVYPSEVLTVTINGQRLIYTGTQGNWVSSISTTLSDSLGSNYITFLTGMPPHTQTQLYLRVNYNVVSESVDPPQPTAPYITASVYNTGENNLYYDYNVRCMPEEGYIFAPLSFTPYSFIIGFGQTPSYTQTSEETLIQVRVFAGGDVSMYSSALNVVDNSDYQHISIVLAAPVYTAGNVVNNQTVHEELQNIPNPITPSGGIVSGAWQPLALKQNLTIVNTPFSYIVDNYLHYFHFPEMAPPEVVKAELLNGTGNLTAPLYDTVDGLTGVMMIIPNYVSGVLTGLISPISETIMLVKDVILSLSDYVYNAMSVLYVFIPFIYLFIPDVIWWGITIYLSYLVFAWTMTLIFGYDVISVFYVDPFVSWVRKRRGGE